MPVDEGRDKPRPDEACDDEAGSEQADGKQFRHERALRDGPRAEQFVGLDLGEGRQGRNAGHRNRRVVTLGSRVETLGRDLEADEYKHGQDHRTGNRLIEPGERAREAGQADKHRGRQGVGSPAAHRLVGGVADVGRGLDDAAAGAGDDRRQPLDGDHPPGVVLVTDRRGALGAGDAADDRTEGEGNHDRQVADRVIPGGQPLELQSPQPLRRPEGRSRIDGHMPLGRGNEAGPAPEVVDATAHEQGSQGAGDAERKRNPGGECGQDDAQ